MKNEDVFLETTIQVERIFGMEKRRKRLRESLSGRRLICSKYVFMELMRGFMTQMVSLHNFILSDGISEAFAWINNELRDRAANKANLCYGLWLKEIESYPAKGYSKADMLEFFDLLIDGGLERRFLSGLNEDLIDEVRCVRADIKPTFDAAHGTWTFRSPCNKKDPHDCGVCDFLQAHHDLLGCFVRAHGNEWEMLDKEVQRRLKTAEKVLGGDDARGDNCTRLSDWIIVLEAPQDSSMATTNEKHYSIPCKLRGISLINPHS